MALHILSNAYRQPPGCIIRVGSTPRSITEPFAFMKEVTVNCHRNRVATATFKLRVRRWGTAWEGGLFSIGEPVSILARFNQQREAVMHGFVSELKASYSRRSNQPVLTTVVCQDASLPLDRHPVQRTWSGAGLLDDRSVAGSILRGYGLALDPASGAGVRYPSLRQDDTDLRFLQARAKANDYELLFDGENVYFGPMRWQTKPQGRIRVQPGAAADCRRFSFHSKRRRGDAPTFHRARGELNSSYYGHVLRVGEPVEVNGVNQSHDGVYYVDAVSHRFDLQGYRQFFTLLRGSGNDDLDDFSVSHPDRPSPLYRAL